MAAEAVLVDVVREISRERSARGGRAEDTAGYPPIRVRFASGADGRLDSSNRRDATWAEVLQSLRDSKRPAYVTIDSGTGYITSLLLPRQFVVTGIRETETGDVEVQLEISQARHFIRRDQPAFKQMLEALEQARRDKTPVFVTESLDGSTIVDVRPAAPSPSQPRRRK